VITVGVAAWIGVTVDGIFNVAPLGAADGAVDAAVGVTVAATGVTALENAGALCTPCALTATTWNMYVVPLVNPGIVSEVALVLMLEPVGRTSTVYPAIELPLGVVQLRDTEPLPAVAMTLDGAAGFGGGADPVPVDPAVPGVAPPVFGDPVLPVEPDVGFWVVPEPVVPDVIPPGFCVPEPTVWPLEDGEPCPEGEAAPPLVNFHSHTVEGGTPP